jgi:hypothetical protein
MPVTAVMSIGAFSELQAIPEEFGDRGDGRSDQRKLCTSAHSRLPKQDEFRVGHLHTSSFGYAAVIDDVEHREAPIRDHTPQSVDRLCGGLPAGFGDDPVRRSRAV